MKIKKKWLVFGLILLFLLGAGIGILLKNPAAQQTAESAAVPVQSVAAVTGCLDKLDVRNRFLGMVLPMETVEIRLDEGRETGGLLVEPGSRVEAGAVLAIYDNTNLSLERRKHCRVSVVRTGRSGGIAADDSFRYLSRTDFGGDPHGGRTDPGTEASGAHGNTCRCTSNVHGLY